MSNRQAVATILKAGLIAGTLDALAASLQYLIMAHKNPINIWYYVASAALGRDPQPGPMTAVAGLFFHYCIATAWATLFYFIYPMVTRFSRNWVANGLVYAFFVWLVMNLVVVPSSRIGSPFKFVPLNAALGLGILMLCIGLPISFIVDRCRRALAPL
jgi:hypothetical protein